MLQTLNFVGFRIINAAATFFRYESASVDSVDQAIRVRADGNDLGVFYPGDALELPVQAQTWEITPLAQTGAGVVRLGLGRVQSARLAGIVAVSNKIGAGVTQTEIFNGGLLATGFLTTKVVDPASNVRGLLVRKAAVAVTAGAGQADCALIAAPAVPASMVPANAFNMARSAPTGGGTQTDERKDMNYQLPAGWGVWIVTNHAVAPTFVSCPFTYEML